MTKIKKFCIAYIILYFIFSILVGAEWGYTIFYGIIMIFFTSPYLFEKHFQTSSEPTTPNEE